MISASEFRKGSKFLYRNEPYIVVDFQHVKPGKGGAFMRTKMRNMLTNLVHEETFRSEEKFESPDLEYREMQYLYKDDGLYQFLDTQNYEQIALDKEQISEVLDFLKEQTIYTILYFSDKPISVAAPLFMELMVKDTIPGVRGDTAQGGATKPATLDTGLVLQVPLFVNEGDLIKVDTRDARYIERVNKK